MTDLRKLAKGRDCTIRVPGYCLRHPETVVLCHFRLIGISGMSMKSPDWLGAFGCFACHQVVDGQQKSQFTVEQRRLMLAEGVFRTQLILADEGYLEIAA